MNTTNADERSYWEVRSALGESVCAVSHLGQQELFFLMYPPPPSKLPIKGDLWKLNSFRKASFGAVRGVQITHLPAPVNSHASLSPSNPLATVAAPRPSWGRRSGLHRRLCSQPHASPASKSPSHFTGWQEAGGQARFQGYST